MFKTVLWQRTPFVGLVADDCVGIPDGNAVAFGRFVHHPACMRCTTRALTN